MICEFCGGKTEKKTLKKQHWLKGRLYIVENVEAEVCGQCGERYFNARTLDAIDQLLQSEHQVSGLMSVEIVTLQQDPPPHRTFLVRYGRHTLVACAMRARSNGS